jgi:hypothetical protein
MGDIIAFVYQFHSGWRYLVIAITLIVPIFFLLTFVLNNIPPRAERSAMAIWAGFVDVQLLLGIVLLVLYLIDGAFEGQQIGHVVLGILTAVVAHGGTIYRRLNGEPNEQMRRILGIALPILAMLLIFGGVASIERGMFESIDKW